MTDVAQDVMAIIKKKIRVDRDQIAMVAVTDQAIAHALDEASRNAAALVEGT